MAILSQVSVVLPSLDPDEKLLTVIDGLLAQGFDDIILVNDGSKPENLHYFETAAAHPQVHILHHQKNLGKGAALKTAFRWFLENRRDRQGVVTVDGDAQHHPEDTVACASHMVRSSRITLGVRDFSLPQVPARSRSGNRITSLVFKIFVGMTISDTQTGLRAIPTRELMLLSKVTGDRFEYETNMLLEMKRQALPFDEVKIRTVYIEENKSSHFRTVRDSWRIYKLILAHFFRYTLSSILSAVLDEGLFVLLTHLLHSSLTDFALTAVPTVGARAVSSLFNFYVNKKLVFQSHGATAKALMRYYLLAVPTVLAQMGLTHGIYLLFNITPAQTLLRAVIYGIVMAVLFLVSFLVQQRWVFTQKEK
jgi:glycosyltransferase involved in cell wall biosynthesis